MQFGSFFWYTIPCNLVGSYQYFKGIFCLHLEDGGCRSLQNVVSTNQLTWFNIPEHCNFKLHETLNNGHGISRDTH
jgi:hypothetical protein